MIPGVSKILTSLMAGGVTFGGLLRVGYITPTNAAVTHARLTARNGAAISTAPP